MIIRGDASQLNNLGMIFLIIMVLWGLNFGRQKRSLNALRAGLPDSTIETVVQVYDSFSNPDEKNRSSYRTLR